MQARQLFVPTLEVLEQSFRVLERKVPPPTQKPWGRGFVYRYAERTIEQAIVQKLARNVSGLHAVIVLLDRGLFQEQGIVQRALDEIGEDIAFLSFGVIRGELTPLHQQYLDYFYTEEFNDPSNPMASHSSRGMAKRQKIRAYVSRAWLESKDAFQFNNASRVITKAYSGFVHAASPHIMGMYGGLPPQFDIRGKFGTL